MATYQTIIPGTRKEWPTGELAYGGTCQGTFQYPASTSPAIPESLTVEYDPLFAASSKSDPTKGTGRNWSLIKKSGEISMTPYSRRRETIRNELYTRERCFAAWKRHWAACEGVPGQSFGPEVGYTTYQEVSDIRSWSGVPGYGSGTATALEDFNAEISDAISTTQQAAFASAMSTYDLLTELMEAKETLSYLFSKVDGAAESLKKLASTDEEAYKRGRRMNAKALLRSSDKALRSLGGRWMEYRYAIMPLIYSFKDVNELLGTRDAVYRTERSRSFITGGFTGEYDGSEGTYITLNSELSANVVSTVKLGYDRGALQRVVAQTAFNPFKTGWELIPMSFVVDWFLNIGDAIASATSVNLASQTACCTSIKRIEAYESVLYDYTVDRSTASFAAGGPFEAQTFEFAFPRSNIVTLQRRRVESYERFLFARPKPRIHFDPYLNWKRTLDGLVLSYQPTKKLLRSL